MELTVHRDEFEGTQIWTLTIDRNELVTAHLQPSDRLLLADCEGPDASIADHLLGLELLARRIEEANKAPRA